MPYENKEKKKIRSKRYYYAHQEELLLKKKEYYKANKEAFRERTIKWRTLNRELGNKLERERYKRNPEKFLTARKKAYRIKYDKKRFENLTDSYLRKEMIKGTNLKTVDIPQQLVELYKLKLIIGRTLKNGGNEKNSK